MTSPEAAAVSVNSHLLSEAMPNIAGITWFANKLVESRFITSQVKSDVISTLGFSDTGKCSRLLSAVEAQVAANPAQFHTLVDILRSQPALMNCVDVITKSYGRWRVRWLRVWVNISMGECGSTFE